jgi:hypothetical protein
LAKKGDSGKSTILKQMRIIHDKNYTVEERVKFKPLIIQNLIDSIIRLVEAMQRFNLDFENHENKHNFQVLLTCNENLKIDLRDWNKDAYLYGAVIKDLWNDESIQKCYERRNQFYLNDSTKL